jgi:hypothetical protein
MIGTPTSLLRTCELIRADTRRYRNSAGNGLSELM